jgi:hypothetical protein
MVSNCNTAAKIYTFFLSSTCRTYVLQQEYAKLSPSIAGASKVQAYEGTAIAGASKVQAYDSTAIAGASKVQAYDSSAIAGASKVQAYEGSAIAGEQKVQSYDSTAIAGEQKVQAYEVAAIAGGQKAQSYDVAAIAGEQKVQSNDVAAIAGEQKVQSKGKIRINVFARAKPEASRNSAPRHCERSEAIQLPHAPLDCFTLRVRNDAAAVTVRSLRDKPLSPQSSLSSQSDATYFCPYSLIILRAAQFCALLAFFPSVKTDGYQVELG